MLRGVIVAPDRMLREGLEKRVAESGHVVLVRSFDHYLRAEEMDGLYRAHSPHLIFFDLSTMPEKLALAAETGKLFPGVHVVALHHDADPSLLLRLMQAGIRELLVPPFAEEHYRQALDRLTALVRETPPPRVTTDLIFGFLPAKAGCGCSTLAMNTAYALTRSVAGKVLLADFDLNCGLSRFLMKLTSPFSVRDALERAAELDDSSWQDMACHTGELDVLASGGIQRSFHFNEGAVRKLVEFAARRYRAVCFDLSGSLDGHSLELLPECRRILLVVQPDLPSVYLAREKVHFLRSIDLEDRVSIVLNRWHRDACLTIADIESALGLPVEHTIADAPAAVYKAMLNAAPVEAASDLGRELAGLALRLAETRPEKHDSTPKRRMVEYFSVLPARYSLFR